MLTSPTRPWKHSLTTIPTKTENSLISLYDLFYNSNKELWVDSTAENEALKGCKLEHDIICLNTSMLKTDGTVDSTQAADITASTWWSNGIDISLPMFDARAKKKEIKCEASVNNLAIFYGNKYVIYDKDSALEPKNTIVFTSRGIKIRNNLNGVTLSWENYSPPSIGIYNSIEKSTTLDILLSAQDKAFKSTLVTQDGFDAYNRLFINPYTNFAVDLVMKATGMYLNKLISNFQDVTFLSPHEYIFGTTWSLFWDVKNPQSIASVINSTNGTDAWFNLLKNTFVWVRAPFYADYIKPDDFEQSLTPESKVVHNELMLSGAGDFKKYDMSITQDATTLGKELNDNKNVSQYGLGAISTAVNIGDLGFSELSMPYIPKTSPTVDIYTSKLLDEEILLRGIKNIGDKDSTNYSSKINLQAGSTIIQEFLDQKVSGNDMIIRGLPVAAINRGNAVNSENTSPDSLIPPNWFDPENRYSDEYYSEMTKFPTVVPKDGNLYVDGRIIGPTIDEIWIMLKKLTGGRLSDEDSKNRAASLDIGIPVGTLKHSNNTDTTMTEVPDSEFNFNIGKVSKYGDPIDFKYDVNVDVTDKSKLYSQKLEITKFVNQNDTIAYPVYNSLKLLSTSIVENTNEGNCCIKKDGEEEITTNREITSFTAWKDISNDSGAAIKDNTNVDDEDPIWGPRKSAPYSLRELEAMIKGNKYNIITQARFVKENFAVTGGLGKRTNPDGEKYNSASGSIYQMHQNYNFDVANPNTFYNNDGTDTGFNSDGNTCGARAVIDDPDKRTFAQRLEGHIRYVEDYGNSDTLSLNPEKFSSQDVYLSAAGDWRYVSDHVRIPILRGEWI